MSDGQMRVRVALYPTLFAPLIPFVAAYIPAIKLQQHSKQGMWSGWKRRLGPTGLQVLLSHCLVGEMRVRVALYPKLFSEYLFFCFAKWLVVRYRKLLWYVSSAPSSQSKSHILNRRAERSLGGLGCLPELV
jgi:hypothetical protein